MFLLTNGWIEGRTIINEEGRKNNINEEGKQLNKPLLSISLDICSKAPFFFSFSFFFPYGSFLLETLQP